MPASPPGQAFVTSLRVAADLRLLLLVGCLLLALPSCSRRVNTAGVRAWQGFVTRYNVLYNAETAYSESLEQFFASVDEDYSQPLALDPLTYVLQRNARPADMSRALLKSRQAIERHSITRKPARRPGWRRDPKAVAEQARSEYNPVLYRAWLTQAKALFYSGQVAEALSAFESISRLYATEPRVLGESRLWQLRAHQLLDHRADVRQLLEEIARKPLPSLTPELEHWARAEVALSSDHPQDAIPHLQRLRQHLPTALAKARCAFLIGQLQSQAGQLTQAEQAYREAARRSPIPALHFTAELRAMELRSDPRVVARRLDRLATRASYRPYRDQVYLSLGETYLRARDSLRAFRSLQLAVDSGRSGSTAWRTAQLRLGELALRSGNYALSHSALTAGLRGLAPNHPEALRWNSWLPALGRLAPLYRSVHRRDSLLRLARLPEASRLRYIDSLIAQVRQRQRTSSVTSRSSEAQILDPFAPQRFNTTTYSATYFNDPQAVARGRIAFIQRWGDRPLADNWNRRSYRPTDSLRQDSTHRNSTSTPTEPALDSLNRSFYLQSLPLTAAAQRSLDSLNAPQLHRMAAILSEELDLLAPAAADYQRLLATAPNYPQREEVVYKLLLLSLRLGATTEAERWREAYLREFASAPRATLLRSPNYLTQLRSQDSLARHYYDEALSAYQRADYAAVPPAVDRLQSLPLPSPLTPRALLLKALASARPGGEKQLQSALQSIDSLHPEAELSTYITALLRELRRGRPIVSTPETWREGRTPEETTLVAPTDSIQSHYPDPRPDQVPDVLVLLPASQSGRLLHELYFALTSLSYAEFTQWSLELLPAENLGRSGYLVRGFRTPADARAYLQALARSDLFSFLPASSLSSRLVGRTESPPQDAG